jgi:hypothetical protein
MTWIPSAVWAHTNGLGADPCGRTVERFPMPSRAPCQVLPRKEVRKWRSPS